MLPPTHPCLATFSGPSIPQLTLFPFRFLTPSVLTFFRPSQFWVLTTQPLFFFSFSSRFRLTAAFPMPVSALASSVSSFSPAWFPVPSFQIPVLSFTVRFLSLFPVSLPQPFHRCLPSVFTFGIFHFRLSFFRPFVFRFQLLSLLFFFSPSSRFRLTAAFPVPVSALASSVSSFSPAWFPVPSFQIPVLSSTVGFLSPYPDSLPQLFLRCLPCALAFGLSPSAPLPFVRVPSGSGYLASVSSFPLSSRFHLTAISSVRPFHFRFFGFPRSFRPGFPCLLSRFFVLGSLFVSFHPSRLRSHSCSTDASLLLSLSGFSLALLSFVCFRSVLTTQPSVLSFPFFPSSPVGGSFGAVRSPCGSLALPLLFGLLPCLSSDSGTQLTALPFSLAVSPHSGYFSASASLAGWASSPLLSL